jgi:hypothetical protein
MFFSKSKGGGVFGAGKAGGVSQNTGDLCSKNLMGEPEEEGGVDSA